MGRDLLALRGFPETHIVTLDQRKLQETSNTNVFEKYSVCLVRCDLLFRSGRFLLGGKYVVDGVCLRKPLVRALAWASSPDKFSELCPDIVSSNADETRNVIKQEETTKRAQSPTNLINNTHTHNTTQHNTTQRTTTHPPSYSPTLWKMNI